MDGLFYLVATMRGKEEKLENNSFLEFSNLFQFGKEQVNFMNHVLPE